MSDWTCSTCNWVNRDLADRCLSCGADREAATPPDLAAWEGPPAGSGAPTLARPDGTEVAMPTAPVAAFGPGGLVGGLVAGAVAAVLGTIVWYLAVAITERQIAFVAIAVGWLVGSAVVFGARRRLSIPLIGGSVLLTLGALGVSEYLIIYHFVTQELGISFDLLQSPAVILELIAESVSADPVTLVFWGIALVVAGYIPFRAMRPTNS
jgi:hypothetical protein